MLGLAALMFVSAASAFAMVWLIGYASIESKILGFRYSPRLLICKFLIPFDIFMTSIMILGPWIIGGGGISHAVFATFTSLGLTGGTLIIRKLMVPKWKRTYNQITSDQSKVFNF